MIDSAKILKLCNNIEDAVVKCAAGRDIDRDLCQWIMWRLDEIKNELVELHGHWDVVQKEDTSERFEQVQCSICGYEPDTDASGLADMFFCARCGHRMDDPGDADEFEWWVNDICAVFYTPEEWEREKDG